MLKIILSFIMSLFLSYAQDITQDSNSISENSSSCDLSKNSANCILDIKNSPIFLHKFIDENDKIINEYAPCYYDEKIQVYDEEYDIINCSNTKNKNGLLTEGVTLNNKNIELKENNILLRVAGDFILESETNININNKKNFILDLIPGTNGKTNLILENGAQIDTKYIFMLEGNNSQIVLDTSFSEIYNTTEIHNENKLDTIIKTDGIYSINQEGIEIFPYNGNIICGPKINPIDSIVATKPNISGIFIENPKIYSNDASDKTNLQSFLPNAKILSKNQGKCNESVTITLNEKEIQKIAQNEVENNETVKNIEEESQNIEDSSTEITMATMPPKDSSTDLENNLKDDEIEANEESLFNEDSKNEVENNETTKIASLHSDFLIIEKDIFDKENKKCDNDLECLKNSLTPFDGKIWDKVSSNNKVNSIYILNLTNNALNVTCDVADYYDNKVNNSLNFDGKNNIQKIDLKFPKSSDAKPQIICRSTNTKKQTNKINITPAKFILNPSFKDAVFDDITTLKAGDISLIFEEASALNLEGEIDSGFNENLIANPSDLVFLQKNKCKNTDDNIFTKEPILINFKNGKAVNNNVKFSANTITKGILNINFNINNNSVFCAKDNNLNMPQCISANINKNINIIPANFMIKTDIISPYKIAYYGQIEDRGSFKFNPLLDIKINAINNKNEPINLNQSCNYGSIQLGLKSDLLIEFKRNASERINSKINIYLNEFNEKQTANLQVYFGITKITDEYQNSRKIKQNDLIEPKEIKLTDFDFKAKFKNGGKYYDYNDLIVYDRLNDSSIPISVLVARGKIALNNIDGDIQKGASVIAKYEIYCETCDLKTLSKYLEVSEPEMDSPNWYLNTKHPSDLYLNDNFIQTKLEIQNSNKALEGRQKISFKNKVAGNHKIAINQKPSGFAPYLNYNPSFENIYLENYFYANLIETNVVKQLMKEINTKEDINESANTNEIITKQKDTDETPSTNIEHQEEKQEMDSKDEDTTSKEDIKNEENNKINSIQLDIEN